MLLRVALFFLVSLGLSQAGGAQPLPENTVIIPFGTGVTPGANGAIWSTESVVWVEGESVRMFNPACMIGFCDRIYDPGKSTVTEVPVAIVENRENATFSITIRDLADPLSAETRVPCADLDEMSQASVFLLDIPVSGSAREHVRIYLLDQLRETTPDYRVVLRVFDAATDENDLPLLTREIKMETFASQTLMFGFSFIPDLSDELDALNVARVRISLSEETEAHLWAFASVTNNESNHPIIIAPE